MRTTLTARAPRWNWALVVFALAAALVAPAPAQAAESYQVTQFGINDGYPDTITPGPDGAMWFTIYPRTLGRITSSGAITRFPLVTDTPNASIGKMVTGPDGALWLADCDTIKRITTSGASTQFRLPRQVCATHITPGPDGALWFTGRERIDEREVGHIGRVTTTGAITEFPAHPGTRHVGTITTGSDGALWFREFGYDTTGEHFTLIVRMTTDGTVTPFPMPSGSCPDGLTVGPDGALWFSLTCRGTIGRLTTGGSLSEFPNSEPRYSSYGVAVGADGALWYVLGNGNIGRMTMDGTFMTLPGSPVMGQTSRGIAAGPDGAMWFTIMYAGSLPLPPPPPMPGMPPMPYPTWSPIVGYIGRVAIPTPPPPPADLTPPTITITAPADGATFSLGQVADVAAGFSCGDASGIQDCTGTVASGSAIDTSAAGTHTFVVNALDKAGNTTTKSVTYTVLAGNATAVVEAGGTVTTDPGGVGATPEVPVQTSIDAPPEVSGTLTVTPQATTTASPAGFGLFGEEVVLEGPAASPASPYEVTFTVDQTALAGIAPSDVQVFRNGVAVTGCTHPSAAIPDPCIVSRGFAPGDSGDALVVVRTSRFSTWNLGRLDYDLTGPFQPVDAAPAVNTGKAGSAIPVKFKLGGDKGLDVFVAGSPKSAVVACPGTTADEIEQTVAESSATLSYDPASTQYTYVWKTEKTMTGCRDLVLRFRDGSQLRVQFNLR